MVDYRSSLGNTMNYHNYHKLSVMNFFFRKTLIPTHEILFGSPNTMMFCTRLRLTIIYRYLLLNYYVIVPSLFIAVYNTW